MTDWLSRHLVAGALFMGMLLVVLLPVLGTVLPLALLLVLVQLPVYLLHQVEEHTGDRFRKWVNEQVFGGVEALHRESILWINLPGVWGVNLVSLYAACFVEIGWGLSAIYLPLVNAVPHILGGLVGRQSNPGLWTSVVLFVPVGGYALRVVSVEPGVGMVHHAAGLSVAVGIHLAIVVYARAMAACAAMGARVSSRK